MTWNNDMRTICRAMLDAADNGTTHAVYVCWTAYGGFADADALLGSAPAGTWSFHPTSASSPARR